MTAPLGTFLWTARLHVPACDTSENAEATNAELADSNLVVLAGVERDAGRRGRSPG
jgi:hypothetical protein